MPPEPPEPPEVAEPPERPDLPAPPDPPDLPEPPQPADPTGLDLARALAGDLAAREQTGRRRWSPSRETLAGRAAAAGLPAPVTGPPGTGPATVRRRALPRAAGRIGGLASSAPFTGPGPGPDDPATVGSAIEGIVDRFDGRARLAVIGLFSNWAALVGSDVAAHSRPTGFVDGVLQVSADSSAWATQLRLLAPTLTAAIDRRLGLGTVARVEVSGPARPSWRHGAWGLRDARGPRDTYG